jgi:predicted Zn finger-like uncharacterized protein
MTLAEGIRRHGFRKWYERRLLTGHAHLAFLLLCVLGLMTALEASTRPQPAADRAADIAVILLCVGAGLWALRRYLFLLTHAEAVANQAECATCKTYGRLDLLQSNAAGDEVIVRCRKCGHEWRIDA